MADETPVVEPGADAESAEAPVVEPELLHGVPLTRTAQGQTVLHPGREQYVDLVRALHDDGHMICLDLCGADYLAYPSERDLPEGIAPERFEVVLQLLSHRERTRIRVRVQVPESDPTLPSLYELHPGTEAMERETFDMFGVTFTGHPDLTRILMPEDWQGHPLRKDYDSGRIPVQFKGVASAR
jgi:NADH-quinone oxidoreductase subunit C